MQSRKNKLKRLFRRRIGEIHILKIDLNGRKELFHFMLCLSAHENSKESRDWKRYTDALPQEAWIA